MAVLQGMRLGASELYYSVDFNSPLNQPGQPPATGTGSQTPSSIVFGSPEVVGSFGHLIDQPLLFRGIDYQQLRFDLGRRAPDYFLDFDFETHNLNPSLFAFMLLFDGPLTENFYLHGSGSIGVPPANSTHLPGWTDDEPHHIHIGVDLKAGSWTFQLDDRSPATGPFQSDSGDIQSIRMNLSSWRMSTPNDPSVEVAVDNIVIGSLVPEPTSLDLFAIGFGSLLLLRRRKRGDMD